MMITIQNRRCILKLLSKIVRYRSWQSQNHCYMLFDLCTGGDLFEYVFVTRKLFLYRKRYGFCSDLIVIFWFLDICSNCIAEAYVSWTKLDFTPRRWSEKIRNFNKKRWILSFYYFSRLFCIFALWFYFEVLAIIYLHKQKIIHRDIKAENICIAADGNFSCGKSDYILIIYTIYLNNFHEIWKFYLFLNCLEVI